MNYLFFIFLLKQRKFHIPIFSPLFAKQKVLIEDPGW